MFDPRILLALPGSPQGGDQSPLLGLLPMVAILAIFYFLLIMPMRNKQKKLEHMIKSLEPGAKVILNPGIYGTIEGVEDGLFLVRIADKTRIKVLKSAIAGLQGSAETEKK